jgi:hypothetical protein
MSKIYNIRWRDSDKDELRKAVKNFNAKITRLEKKNPQQKNALPERVSVREIENLITSRNDLKRELNSLRRFTERGAEELVDVPDSEYNLKITKWQKKEMNIRVGVINRRRKQRYDAIKDIEMESRGEGLGYTIEQASEQISSGTIDSNNTKPLNVFTPKMTRTDLRFKFKTILTESQDNYWNEREEIMRQTYIRTLLENFAEEDIRDVIEQIENMSFRDFYESYLKDAGRWESLYPGSKDDYDAYVEGLRSTWNPQN